MKVNYHLIFGFELLTSSANIYFLMPFLGTVLFLHKVKLEDSSIRLY